MNTTTTSEIDLVDEINLSPEIKIIMNLVLQAGEVLKKYHQTNLDVEYKKDEFDPVSIADKESDALLRAGITSAFPDDEILSEESPLLPESYSKRVWMVDPLDDTKGYLAGRDTAGVMIGLLENGKPKIGVVYLPFRNEWYFGEAAKGAFRKINGATTRLHVRAITDINESVLVGRNLVKGDTRPIDNAIASLKFKGTVPEGCIGAKIGLVASGEADAFIHTNLKAGKWDTLASEVIITEAGGSISDIDGFKLDYTKPTSGWDRYFIATGTNILLQKIVTLLAEVNSESRYF